MANEDTMKAQRCNEAVTLANQGRYGEALERLLPFSNEVENHKLMYALAYCHYKLKQDNKAYFFAERARDAGSRDALYIIDRIERRGGNIKRIPNEASSVTGADEVKAVGGTGEDEGGGGSVSEPLKKREVTEGDGLIDSTGQGEARDGHPKPEKVLVLYPWMPDPERMLCMASHRQHGTCHDYRCKANEFLNVFRKAEAGQAGWRSQLGVCPVLGGVESRNLSWLEWIILMLLRLLFFILFLFLPPFPILIYAVMFAVLAFMVMVMLSNPLFLICGLVLLIPFFLFGLLLMFPGILVFLSKIWLHNWAAGVIRRNPESALAITLMFMLSPLYPRYWVPGEIRQICRVNRKGWICGKRAYVLFVAGAPLPRRAGLFSSMFGAAFPFKYLFAKRRIYAVWMDKGEDEADRVAEEAARVLGLTVQRGFIKPRGVNFP